MEWGCLGSPLMAREKMPETWQETPLWTSLELRSDDAANKMKVVVAGVLPKVEELLRKGDTTPHNFTLHDEHHSRRVAEWMTEVAGDSLRELSAWDLGLLLLSAYLHDIGMTPPVGRVTAHFTYLLTGEGTDLTEEEIESLQAFLDDHWDGLVPPIATARPTAENVKTASQAVAAYVRESHNEWSERWIRENLGDRDDDLYSGWIEDLVLLCKSHHYGIEALSHHDFDPRTTGSEGPLVHLRYCACLLRIADVLDLDPERTPKVLFGHRDIEGKSAIFWHKDQVVGVELNDGEVAVRARPLNAVTHHAVVCTIADIERELQLCDLLAQEKPFDQMKPGRKEIPYRWTLKPHLQKSVEPLHDSYEYVDGTFQPDPKKVLDLVGGVELYGSDLVTVRELLQNAFDAVREQIARERLLQRDPASEQTLEELARTHEVALELEQDEDEIRMICRDTGSGMSKDIILSRFLIGGKTANHEMRSLERRCRAQGFSVGRTARFGIGVLSYFLLGSRLEIATRRSIQADPNNQGWKFQSDGLEDFGELSKSSDCGQGTEVTLYVRRDALEGGYEQFAEELSEYVRSTVRRVPCRFRCEMAGSAAVPILIEPGWSADEEGFADRVIDDLTEEHSYVRQTPKELLPVETRQERERIDDGWDELGERVRGHLVISTEVGEIPGDLGSYRLSTAHFEVEGMSSIGYMDLKPLEDGTFEIGKVGTYDAFHARFGLRSSWNGMEVSTTQGTSDWGPPNSLLEVDWTSDAAGRLAVDRNRLRLSEAAKDALEALRGRARQRLKEIVDGEETPITLTNARIAGVRPANLGKASWMHRLSRGRVLKPLVPPLADLGRLRRIKGDGFLWREAPVTFLPELSSGGRSGATLNPTWHGSFFEPQRAVVAEASGKPLLVILWEELELRPETDPPFGLTVAFPPAWARVVGFEDHTGTYWNRDHPLVGLVDRASWEWVNSAVRRSRDIVEHADDLLGSPNRFAAWILHSLDRSADTNVWNGMRDRNPDLIPRAWEAVSGLSAGAEIVHINEAGYRLEISKVDSRSWGKLVEDEARQWMHEAAAETPAEWQLQRPADGLDKTSRGHL